MNPLDAPETDPPAGDAEQTTHTGHGNIHRDSPAHYGRGNQILFQGVSPEDASRFEFGDDGLPRLRRRRRRVAGDRLGVLRRRFVAPPGLDEENQRRYLDTHGALVLLGRQGDGLRTAAHMLLVPGGQENDHDVREDLTSEEEVPRLDVEELRKGERLLLDLTRNGTPLTDGVLGGLEALRDQARKVGSWLVVLLDRRDEARVPAELRDHVVRLGRPSPIAVLARHLDSRDVPGFFPRYVPEAVREWAGHASMGELEEFARRVERVYQDRDRAGRVTEWLDAALEVGGERLLEPLEKATGRGRAILFAASLLEQAPVERLSSAVERLLPMIASPENETPPLERHHFRKELVDLGLEVGEDRRIRFERIGQASAIRNELWDAYPWLHGVFDDWADTCVRDPELLPVDRDRVTERWTGQVLRVDRPYQVFARIEEWSRRTSRGGNHAPQAAVALATALQDARHGRFARHQIYRWARNRRLPRRFAQVLIAVCVQELVTEYPEQALVRLHLFADHEEAEVARTARTELLELAQDRSFHRRALRRLSNRLRERDEKIDQWLFRELTRPEFLLRGSPGRSIDPGLLGWVGEGLVLLLIREPSMTRSYGELWAGRSEQFMEILVRASSRAGTLSSLYTTALRLPRGASGPEELRIRRRERELLLRRIDEAQGVHLAGAPTAPQKENE